MLNANQIQEHMKVVGSDGVHVGTVDRIEGADTIKLTRSDPASDGKHRFIPVAWVDHVDAQVHLNKDSSELQSYWKKH